MQLVTHQTGPQGQKVQRLLIEETVGDRPRALSRASCSTALPAKLVFMASQAGGMEIEEVAHKTPEADLQGVHRSGGRVSARTRRASWRSSWG